MAPDAEGLLPLSVAGYNHFTSTRGANGRTPDHSAFHTTMTPNRDHETSTRLLPLFRCDAADGQSLAPEGTGGLTTEGRLLPVFTDSGVPTLECTLHFPPTPRPSTG